MKTVDSLDLPETLGEWADPARTALLVYDMQVGICRQVNSETTVANVGRALAAARSAGMRVIFTRHLSLPRKLMGRMAYRTAMAWQRTDDPDAVEPWFLRDSPGFAITPELTPRADEAVFDKITMSAFEGTPLDIVLRDCGVRAYLIAGVALEVGIEPTVRHSADLGYIPVVVRDACGAGNADAGKRSLDALAFAGDALIATTDEVCAALSASGRT
jgi:nicotinamidase-related amidase